MLNNPLCVKDGQFLYLIGTRGTTREKKSRRDQSHEEKSHRDPLEPLLPAVKPLSFSDSTRDMAHFTRIY
jgi:hypothetical protein